MYLSQRRKREMLVRVLDFIDHSSDFFPEHSVQHELAGVIRCAIGKLGNDAVNQLSGLSDARAGAIHKRRARQALRQDLSRIVRTARLISQTLPNFSEPFKLPPGNNDQTLIELGRQFAVAASAHYDVFIRYSMSADFIDELKKDVAQLEAAREDRTNSRAHHRTASLAIEISFKEAMHAVRNLDVIMANVLRNDGLSLYAWSKARHVTRSRRKAAAAAAAAAETNQSSPSAKVSQDDREEDGQDRPLL
jgi:hypothetical protein